MLNIERFIVCYPVFGDGQFRMKPFLFIFFFIFSFWFFVFLFFIYFFSFIFLFFSFIFFFSFLWDAYLYFYYPLKDSKVKIKIFVGHIFCEDLRVMPSVRRYCIPSHNRRLLSHPAFVRIPAGNAGNMLQCRLKAF